MTKFFNVSILLPQAAAEGFAQSDTKPTTILSQETYPFYEFSRSLNSFKTSLLRLSLAVKGDDKGTLHFKSFDIDGIDPITISMFDQFFSFQTVSFSQDGPEKFFVSLDFAHTSHE